MKVAGPLAGRHLLSVAPLAVFLLAAFVVPVLVVLGLGMWQPGAGLDFSGFKKLATTPVYATVFGRSLAIAWWTTLYSLLGALPIALAIHAARGRWKPMLLVAVLIPFWTSAMVKGFAWMVLLGRNGALNGILSDVFQTRIDTNLLYSEFAVVTGIVHCLMPFMVLSILPVLEGIDPRLGQASSTLGAGRLETFIRVVLPLARPGIAAGCLIVFITALGFFIVPALLGGPQQTMVANIIIELVQEMMNWKLAGALAFALFAVVGVLLLLYNRFFGMATLIGQGRAVVSSDSGATRQLWSGGRGQVWKTHDKVGATLSRLPAAQTLARILSIGTVALLLLFLLAPAFFLVPVSFSRSAIIDWPPEFFSLKWYEALLTPNWTSATVRSVSVAFFTGLLSICLALPAAIWFVRHAGRWRIPALLGAIAPMIVPRILIAVGLFWLFARMGLIGSELGLVLGHTVIALPFVTLTLISVIQAYDERLDLAAAICGAAPAERLRRITLPLLAPGLLSAFLFACVTSIDELTIALFVTGGLSNTLPKQMWDEASIKVSPTLASASTVMFIVMAIAVVSAERLKQKKPA